MELDVQWWLIVVFKGLIKRMIINNSYNRGTDSIPGRDINVLENREECLQSFVFLVYNYMEVETFRTRRIVPLCVSNY